MRAFQMQAGGPRGRRQPERGGLFRKLIVAAMLGFIAMGAGLYFSPQVRPKYIAWFHTLMAHLSRVEDRPANAPARNSPEPAVSIVTVLHDSVAPRVVLPPPELARPVTPVA